jgi:hypothetical protein
MDSAARERLERQHRPHLFEDCRACGENSVRTETHVCDPVRRDTYQASLIPAYEPNEEMVKILEEKLYYVLVKHKIVVTSGQLRDLALAVKPSTRGPVA